MDDVEIDDEEAPIVLEDGEELKEDDDNEEEVVVDDTTSAEDGDEDQEDEDVEAYGKKVQRRINKEVQKRKVLEDKLANQEAEYERRFSEFEERFNAKESEAEHASVSEKLKDVESRRKELHEVGDYDQDLEDEWFDLKLKQRESKSKSKPRNKPEQSERPPEQQSGQQAEIPDAQKKWLDSNANWYGKNSGRSKYANDEYQTLISEGYDPEDADTYVELDSRMNGTNNASKSDREEIAPPPAPPNRGGNAPKRKGVSFTKADEAKMIEWNLNPKDADQRKAWLEEKRRTA